MEEWLTRSRPPVRAAVCAGFAAGLLSAYELRARFVSSEQRPALLDRYVQRWGRRALDVFGMRLTVEGHASACHGAPRLVVSNHRSPIDILLMLGLFGGHVLSRGDLAGWPFVGLAARRVGTIFVDRDSRASGANAIRAIRAQLKRGRSVSVFPEGTTFRGDEVRPFRPGAFVAVRGLDATIQPVGIAYPAGFEWFQESFPGHVARVARRRRTRVVVCVGEPQPAVGSSRALAEAMHTEVQRLAHEARALHDAG